MIVRIEDIKPNSSNPRTIKDEDFQKLVKSIRDFPEMLEARPLIVNKDHVILGGNMRYRAAQKAGLKEIHVKEVDWPEEKQREFIIKDNVSGGEWDWDELANSWEKELLVDWGLDLPTFNDLDQAEGKDQDVEWSCPECGHINTPNAFKSNAVRDQ